MLQDYINIQVPKILKQRNLSLVFGVSMLFANILLVFGILNKEQKVILVPPEINKTFWVTNKQVSKEYLEEMAVFLSHLLLDQSPTSSKHKRDMLLKYISPSYYNELFGRIIKQEKYLYQNNISTRFSIKEIEVDSKQNQVFIVGDQENYVADKKVGTVSASYKISFEYKGARYLLTEFIKLEKE